MISIDFLNKVYKILDSQEYNLSFSPAKFKNYMLCLLYTSPSPRD